LAAAADAVDITIEFRRRQSHNNATGMPDAVHHRRYAILKMRFQFPLERAQ